ncbi:hypothetical protein OO184_19945 [Photorhabdus sp. APURE]|uniref:hypothetical protein n=1 Tax=Photorhabdus aballayi TaxID=2991723 RepID=UPI00223D2239|nr:hypothetical protein [Photorhabdus aballayi]MCW7550140.1 hypothetical protein [Photorhabdus aballayi]
MSIKHTAKYQQLVTKLREVFLIDRPELNFGIYLILSVHSGKPSFEKSTGCVNYWECELEVMFKQVIPLLQSITDYYYRINCTYGHSIVADSYLYDREPKRYLNITHHKHLDPNGQK